MPEDGYEYLHPKRKRFVPPKDVLPDFRFDIPKPEPKQEDYMTVWSINKNATFTGGMRYKQEIIKLL